MAVHPGSDDQPVADAVDAPREPAWKRINALFAKHGLNPPPTRLRDELVAHLLAYEGRPL